MDGAPAPGGVEGQAEREGGWRRREQCSVTSGGSHRFSHCRAKKEWERVAGGAEAPALAQEGLASGQKKEGLRVEVRGHSRGRVRVEIVEGNLSASSRPLRRLVVCCSGGTSGTRQVCASVTWGDG